MKSIKFLTAAALLIFSATASALPVTGGITFGMSGSFDDIANTVSISGDSALITGASGLFASEGVEFGEWVTYNSFSYATPFVTVDPLWTTAEGFSFALTNIFSVDESTPGFLDLTGLGIVSYAGYSDTTYAWSFSIDSTGEGLFAMSSTNTPVPAPGIALLLGIGLIGFGVTRKLRKA